jgi:hypothetical protein
MGYPSGVFAVLHLTSFCGCPQLKIIRRLFGESSTILIMIFTCFVLLVLLLLSKTIEGGFTIS